MSLLYAEPTATAQTSVGSVCGISLQTVLQSALLLPLSSPSHHVHPMMSPTFPAHVTIF